MEVKINREIRNYTESMFFGLSMRQFIFSVLACGVAVGLYFILRPYFGVETLSWMCILGAAPFGFVCVQVCKSMNPYFFYSFPWPVILIYLAILLIVQMILISYTTGTLKKQSLVERMREME